MFFMMAIMQNFKHVLKIFHRIKQCMYRPFSVLVVCQGYYMLHFMFLSQFLVVHFDCTLYTCYNWVCIKSVLARDGMGPVW